MDLILGHQDLSIEEKPNDGCIILDEEISIRFIYDNPESDQNLDNYIKT